MSKPIAILFVCLGNICRSPMAEGIMQNLIDEHKQDYMTVDSAGTGDWHLGLAPEERAVNCARQHDINILHLRARLITVEDFSNFDHIFVMDNNNMAQVIKLAPPQYQHKIRLLGSFMQEGMQISDPYYENEQAFDMAFTLMHQCCRNLLHELSR